MRCPDCKGAVLGRPGYHFCVACDGEGWDEIKHPTYDEVVRCSECLGEGEIRCKGCQGTGEVSDEWLYGD